MITKSAGCYYGVHFGCLCVARDPNCHRCAERLKYAVNYVLHPGVNDTDASRTWTAPYAGGAAEAREEVRHIDQYDVTFVAFDRITSMKAISIPARVSLSSSMAALWTDDSTYAQYLTSTKCCGNSQFQQRSGFKSFRARSGADVKSGRSAMRTRNFICGSLRLSSSAS